MTQDELQALVDQTLRGQFVEATRKSKVQSAAASLISSVERFFGEFDMQRPARGASPDAASVLRSLAAFYEQPSTAFVVPSKFCDAATALANSEFDRELAVSAGSLARVAPINNDVEEGA